MSSASRSRRGRAKGRGGGTKKEGVVEEVEEEVRKVEKAAAMGDMKVEMVVDR